MVLGGPGRNAVWRTASMLTMTRSEFQKAFSLWLKREATLLNTQGASQVGTTPSTRGPDSQKFSSSQFAAPADPAGSTARLAASATPHDQALPDIDLTPNSNRSPHERSDMRDHARRLWPPDVASLIRGYDGDAPPDCGQAASGWPQRNLRELWHAGHAGG